MISLMSKRAIISDINDIKECHKNLTEGRLPTILLYRIPKLRRRARASAHLEIQKGWASEKKEGGKGASLRSSDPPKRLTYHKKGNDGIKLNAVFSLIVICFA